MSVDRPRIAVTVIGEYIRHRACERRFKLDLQGRKGGATLPFAARLFNPLDPVLQAAGQRREDELADSLIEDGMLDLSMSDGSNLPFDAFLDAIARLEPGEQAFARQVEVESDLGAFRLVGNIDFVLVSWQEGAPLLRLVECKASRRDHTYQHVQVALYRNMVRTLLDDGTDVECVVARIDEATNQMVPLASLAALDLTTIEADIVHLLAPGGPLDSIAGTDLDSLAYQLDATCDDCRFNVNCLPESARQRRIELLGIEPSAVRTLVAAGITTIDDVAALEPDGTTGLRIQATPGFGHDLEHLRAQARARATTLPGGKLDPDDYPVEQLPFSRQSQLPDHQMPWGDRLVRVYLEMNFDYVENRVGALAAHVTTSTGQIDTRFTQVDERWKPDPTVRERHRQDDEVTTGPLEGVDVVEVMGREWSSDTTLAAREERDLIERFFQRLTLAMRHVAGTEMAPIHFYVWSANEVSRLVEACARCDSRLLGNLHQLLGCRESLEQLIFSSLEEEVDRRYALGWTGRGLSVVSTLRWFGRQYHWVRVIDGEVVQLDRAFEQDIFDFKTTLACLPDGSWADPDDETATKHTFEIRSRFGDSLKAPYWRAHWGTLPDPATVKDGPTRAAIARYNRTAQPGYLPGYLTARVHALRWVEENVRFKNHEIQKPPLDLDELVNFSLGVDDVRTAAIDFLKLDQHIKRRNWTGEHLMPPAGRVGRGRTIPLSRVMPVEGHANTFSATIDLSRYHLDAAALASVCSFGVGDFVRLCEHPDGSPNNGHRLGQLLYGYTCTIQHLDWESGEIVLSVIPGGPNHYRLGSFGKEVCILHATVNESVSDFVGGRVEQRLDSGLGTHIDRWFDRTEPHTPQQSPPDDITLRGMRTLLESIKLDGGYGYDGSQVDAVLDGLSTRVQALQGPPGTGKTTTTALATLTRILARRQVGDVVLIAANTHTAVDTLLAAIERLLPEFEARVTTNGMRCPAISLNKAHSTNPPLPTGGIGAIGASKPLTSVQKLMKEHVVVIGGTTGSILKLVAEMNKGSRFKNLPEGFQTSLLVVDEASMLVFPHFLALATQVAADGEIMLAGDQRQLAPIVAHDWDNEDRPPVLLYQPHLSAIAMVQSLADAPGMSPRAIRRSALNHTFRLPGVVRELVARLYQRDDIDLRGNPVVPPSATQALEGDWGWIWEDAAGLFLVLHDERLSRQSNPLEVEVIHRMLAAGGELADGSVAIVTPHRAQRTLLRHELAAYTDGPVDVIDVVEKLQGNERQTVIVSGTASDTAAINATAEFILGLNRSNVAFSRPQARLIVICAATLLNHIAADFEVYQEALLWKSLRVVCSREAGRDTIDGHTVRVYIPEIEHASPTAFVAD